MLAISLLGMIAAAVNVYFAATQSQRMGSKIREDLFKKVSFLSNHEFEHFGDASLITRTTNDVIQIQNVMVMILRMMLQSPIMLIGAGIMAYNKQPALTAVFLVAIPVLVFMMLLGNQLLAGPGIKPMDQMVVSTHHRLSCLKFISSLH